MIEYEYFGKLPRFEKLEMALEGHRGNVKRVGAQDSSSFKYPGEMFVKIPKHQNPYSNRLHGEAELSNSMILNEFLVSLMLLKRGYPVIQPYGIYEVNVPGSIMNLEKDLVVPAFVTQFKEGISYDPDSENKSWLIEYEEELSRLIDKAEEDGFEPYFDADWSQNALWVPKEKKLYLIDFEFWLGNEKEKGDLSRSLGFNP